jgi:hypothetical protein
MFLVINLVVLVTSFAVHNICWDLLGYTWLLVFCGFNLVIQVKTEICNCKEILASLLTQYFCSFSIPNFLYTFQLPSIKKSGKF